MILSYGLLRQMSVSLDLASLCIMALFIIRSILPYVLDDDFPKYNTILLFTLSGWGSLLFSTKRLRISVKWQKQTDIKKKDKGKKGGHWKPNRQILLLTRARFELALFRITVGS
ncbi:hypothetical protein V8F33_003591 [Rhypophila sp. PSN 637]